MLFCLSQNVPLAFSMCYFRFNKVPQPTLRCPALSDDYIMVPHFVHFLMTAFTVRGSSKDLEIPLYPSPDDIIEQVCALYAF